MLPHGKEHFFVGWVSATAEGLEQSVTAFSGVPEAGDVGIGGALAVLAGGYHHNVALDGPERR